MTERTVPPFLKLLLEIGPIAVFFLSYRFGERLLAMPGVFDTLAPITGEAALTGENGPLFVSTAVFMVAITISLSVSWSITRSLPKMAVVTAVVVVVFGGLTLWLQDGDFIKMKPTIVNGIFALALGFGLLQGQSYLKVLVGDVFPLKDEGWMILTRRWMYLFAFMAVLNELVWRTQSTDFWFWFKILAGPPITLGFLISQWPMLQRHAIEQPEDD